MHNKTSIPEHRLIAIEESVNEIEKLAKQLMFNNSLRGRAITVQCQLIKENVRRLKPINPDDLT